MNIGKQILKELSLSPNKVRLIVGNNSLTGQELIDRVENRSNLLKSHIFDNQVICIEVRDSVSYWIDLIALWTLNAIVVPLGKNLNKEEKKYILRHTEAFAFLNEFGQLVGLTPFLSNTKDPALPAGTAAILFTSGSTGMPKGVILSHEGLWTNAIQTDSRLELTCQDRLFVPVPFHFVSCLSHFLVSMYCGACFIGGLQRTSPRDLIKEIQHYSPTAFGASPLHCSWVLAALEEGIIQLRWVMSSGDHLSPAVVKRFLTLLPHTQLYVVYGMTELSGRFCIATCEELLKDPTTVGIPLPGFSVKTVDADNSPNTSQEDAGELWVKGPMVTVGYFKAPQSNQMSFYKNWFKTGDIGRIIFEKQLTLLGRKDEVFKCLGLKVSCTPIADTLLETGEFADVAILAKRHEEFGHVPQAFFVLKPGRTFQKAQVLKYLKDRLGTHHVPHDFKEVEFIPRTGSGKVDRKKLG